MTDIEHLEPGTTNLVLCFDGTGNQFGPQNTSIVRLTQALDRESGRQRVYYDPGIGTLPEPGLATWIGQRLSDVMELAFAFGLTRKVVAAYTFLMETWRPGDKVFLFGFSRGAYTARVLAAMLHGCGLLPKGNHHLVPYVMRLFAAVRGRERHADQSAAKSRTNYWRLLDEFRWSFARQDVSEDRSNRFPIWFLGAWDTVSSVGWVWDPASYPYTAENPGIKAARHAISIDERRCFFRQNVMKAAEGQDLQERWFPGVHSDVGGGYTEEEGGLWRAPFAWIVSEARGNGLLVTQARLDRVLTRHAVPAEPWAEPAHESLHGAWWLAELFPKWRWSQRTRTRRLGTGLGRHRFIDDGSVFDEAALRRIRSGRYAPPNVPPEFIDHVIRLTEAPDCLALRRS